MDYLPDMEKLPSDMLEQVLSETDSYNPAQYTQADVYRALRSDRCTIEELKTLLSPAAAPYLEQMAAHAKRETGRHFGSTVYLFTPLYISNYCDNRCVYCGFQKGGGIARKKLTMPEIEHEMQIIARSGIEEVLILTGESRTASDLSYIGDAAALGKKYFRNRGLEIYPVNVSDYRALRECGIDYITVFQETYNKEIYETLHLGGRKRAFEYRFYAQERALLGGMRGVGLSALFGLSDFRKDALASALHAYYLQRKYPAAEISLSCPRIRPIKTKSNYGVFLVSEAQLVQIICAYRIFLPFVGITVSSRESKQFRDGIMKIAATKVSAGVSTGIGDHKSKYENSLRTDTGDEQFEIADGRSFSKMYNDICREGLQPVLNDYIYV